MAIMQDWSVLLWKIAKMQDEGRTTQTTEPHRKFFVLILERAGGQSVRHLLVNVTAKLSFTFLTSEYHRSPKYIMGKIEKNRLMAWQSHFKKHDTAPRICFERQFVARSCADVGITPSYSTVIHHKRASRYVVLGEISHSPFTTYIFITSWWIVKGADSAPMQARVYLLCWKRIQGGVS